MLEPFVQNSDLAKNLGNKADLQAGLQFSVGVIHMEKWYIKKKKKQENVELLQASHTTPEVGKLCRKGKNDWYRYNGKTDERWTMLTCIGSKNKKKGYETLQIDLTPIPLPLTLIENSDTKNVYHSKFWYSTKPENLLVDIISEFNISTVHEKKNN